MKFFFLLLLFGFNAQVFSTEPIDVVIACQERDRRFLDQCIKGVRETIPNVQKIIVVSKEPYSSSADWFNENRFPFSRDEMIDEMMKKSPYRSPHKKTPLYRNPRIEKIFYQLVRLYFCLVIPEISSNVLAIDARAPLNPVKWISETGEPYFYPVDKETDFSFYQKLLPDLLSTRGMMRENEFSWMFQRPIIEDLLTQFAAFHRCDAWRGIVKWMEPMSISQSDFCEYDLYHWFYLLRSMR